MMKIFYTFMATASFLFLLDMAGVSFTLNDFVVFFLLVMAVCVGCAVESYFELKAIRRHLEDTLDKI